MFHNSEPSGARWWRYVGGWLVCVAVAACGGGGDGGGAAPGPGGDPGSDPVDSTADNVLVGTSPQLAQTDQVLVRLVQDLAGRQFEERAAEYAQSLSLHAGITLRTVRRTASGSVVMALPKAMGAEEVQAVAQRLMASDEVAHAEPDLRVFSDAAAPNDPRWNDQWSLAPAASVRAGVQAQAAWTLTSGSPSVVVAVLDTGVLPHADIQDRLLPGYDFVSNANHGNDGDGRDPDASDPGDWVVGNEAWLPGASPRNSGWHGTHVAGIVAAQRDNGLGISGIDAAARVLPVRVLGRGGGYISDVADGLMWAVGAPVSGAPTNSTPARVINLSLGGSGACSREMQNALDEAWARGAVVVASAGNLAQDVASTVVASCERVLVIAALGRGGEQASYSNFGAGVDLAAPGGNAASDNGILSLGDGGTQAPRRDNSYRRKRGTSMAAPHVTGTVALMLAANPGLTPVQVHELLRASARPFAWGTVRDCAPQRCGAGALDAAAAVSLAALYPAHQPLTGNRMGTDFAAVAAPAVGWWRDATDASRQAFVDVRGQDVLLSVQYRDGIGRAVWGHARLAADPEAGALVGRLIAYEGGASLTGGVRPPTPAAVVGDVRWEAQDDVSVRLSTPTGVLTLVRDASGAPAAVPAAGARTGVWWTDERPGLRVLLEQQDAQLRVGVHGFNDNGQPAWSSLTLLRGADGVFRGAWQRPSDSLPHTLLAMDGMEGEWVWVSALEGRLRLPDGRYLTLRASTHGDVDEARAQSASLLGIWRADYVLGRSFSERWILAHLLPSEVNAGDYNVWGINQWGGTVVGGWSSRYANHSLYAPGLAFDDFYRFQMDEDGIKGCYHHYHIALATLSACVPFSAERLGIAGEALNALPTLALGRTGDRSKEAMLQTTVATRSIVQTAQADSVDPGLLAGKRPDPATTQMLDWQRQLSGVR